MASEGLPRNLEALRCWLKMTTEVRDPKANKLPAASCDFCVPCAQHAPTSGQERVGDFHPVHGVRSNQ